MSDTNEVTPEFLANFTQAWNDKDLDKLMEHMADGCVFMASVGTETEGTNGRGEKKSARALPVCGKAIQMPTSSRWVETLLRAIGGCVSGYLRGPGYRMVPK